MPDLLSWGLLSLRSAKQAFRPSTRPRAHVHFPSLNAQLSTLEITCSFSTSGDSDGRLVCVVCACGAHMCCCLRPHSPLSGFCLFHLNYGDAVTYDRRNKLQEVGSSHAQWWHRVDGWDWLIFTFCAKEHSTVKDERLPWAVWWHRWSTAFV